MSDVGERTDEKLARAAKQGDADAYDLLVRRYLRPSMALARQYASQLEDAEDIVQEAFHRAVRGLPDYDDRRPFNTWFYTILRNVARSTISKQSRRATLAPVTLLEDDHPAPTAIDPILVGDIEQAIQTLAQMQQMCIRLCDIEGLTSVEAARMLDVDAGTVRTHLHRARQKLRAVMDLQKRMTP